MASYETVIHSPMSPKAAFDYMADLRNFSEWDPGVKKATQVVMNGPALGAEYDLELAAMTLRYKTTEFDQPGHVKVEAHSSLLSSFDTVEVIESTDGGCDVRYEAIIELSGPLKLVDPLFGLLFNRIGDKAAAGMEKALNGSKVS